MRLIFVDTSYWLALAIPRDPWREQALRARQRIGPAKLVTTDEVIVEFLNGAAGFGPAIRAAVIGMAEDIYTDPHVTIAPQTHQTLRAGMDLYERRTDIGYSLTDCISMNAMRERGIAEILTSDHHFEQEGFSVLIGP